MSGRGEQYEGLWGWVRLIIVPSIYGIVLSIFIVRFIPKLIILTSQARPFMYSVEKSVDHTFAPYISMLSGGDIDSSALLLPIICGLIVSFGFIMYYKDV